MYITKKEYNGRNSYSTTCKDKDKNLVYFLDLQFPRDNEPNGTNIKIKDFFMSCYQSKDGIKPKMIITKYEENGQATQEYSDFIKKTTNAIDDSAFADFGNCIEIDESELAFYGVMI